MNMFTNLLPGLVRLVLLALVLLMGGQAQAIVDGWTGDLSGTVRTFQLTARDDFISTSDGNSHYTWGYAHGAEFAMQYPGPTLIVNQGDTVKIILNNSLPVPVSIVFPGQHDVTASGGMAGVLTREAPAVPAGSNTVVGGPTYSFVATEPGTYLYHSGTQADLQVEMGLVGALIVRPSGFAYGDGSSHPARKAYQQAGTEYDRESLLLLSEMDPAIHAAVYAQVYSGQAVAVDMSTVRPSMWFINGRNAPDTQLDDYVYWLPTQPYSALPRMHPGEKLLMRVINAGRDLHPLHHHGNHATAIARDGRVLSSQPSVLSQAPDLTSPDFTIRSIPGQTVDLIYEWTGKGLGWDIYGTVAEHPHTCTPLASGPYAGFDASSHEWCADHNKPIPVLLPGVMDGTAGEHYSGSPFLGWSGSLPQGHPGLNTTGGYYHMLHSHNEKEVTTDNIFPGGMMTMLVVEPWSVDLDAGTAPSNVGGGGGVVLPPVMPTLTVLDNFNRGNATTLNNTSRWSQVTLFGQAAIRVNSNQAYALTPGAAYWNFPNTGYGAQQAAAFSFGNTPVAGSSLVLKASGGSATLPASFIRVRYTTSNIVVETTANAGLGYTNAGNLSTTAFAANDRLSAMVTASGMVYVWKTTGGVTSLIGSASSSFTGVGRIGMQLPSGARVDDFAGGDVQ